MKSWLMIAVLAVGSLFAVAPASADAHWGYGGYRGGYYSGYRGGYYGNHGYYGHSYYRTPGYYGYGYRPGYYYRAPSYGYYYNW